MKNKIKRFITNWLVVFKYLGSLGALVSLMFFISTLLNVYLSVAIFVFIATTLIAVDFNNFKRARGDN